MKYTFVKRAFLLVGASLPIFLPMGIATAACVVDTPDQVITGFRNSDIFVPSGQIFHVDGADINGSIFVNPHARLTITASLVNGTVEADEGSDVSICIENSTVIEGNVDVANSNESSLVIIDGSAATVEVKGAVELDKSDSPNCGGALRIVDALIRSDVQTTGACESAVLSSDLEGDFQATGTKIIRFENNVTTSDVAADFGQDVHVNGNPVIGGDLEFVGFATVRIAQNGDVNGGLFLADNHNADLVDNQVNGDIQADADPDKVNNAIIKVRRNLLKGSLSIDSSDFAITEARVENNQVLNGNLTVIGAADVTVISNIVPNGNLSIENFVRCAVGQNEVSAGNNLGCVKP